MAIWYRVVQFWRLVFVKPLPENVNREVTAVLTAEEEELFHQFSISDQWHSYRVMRTLQHAGHHRRELLVAALLHDIGKTRLPVSVWDRTLIVLGTKLWPQKTAVWGSGDPAGWKRPFVVKAQHPAWGAEMAAAAGCDSLTVALIRRHQEKAPPSGGSDEEQLLRLLQWADDQN
jgi:hypothetical protein